MFLLNWFPAGAARGEALAEMEAAAAAEDERLTDTTTTIILIITRRITLRPAAGLPPVAGGGIQGARSVDIAPVSIYRIHPDCPRNSPSVLPFTAASQMNHLFKQEISRIRESRCCYRGDF